ncbi:hypothetical protein AT2G34185 [Arabidopsis thaliana]|uniref:Uncharacterized protein n=4 Tax=Arabidopsis TaxID=3701 RepID=F4IGW7_ARATH|nr:uncharacterized protein AT2G34185 [Arabidopsis thaliana]AEC08931.1 hypothetical protein AT2G34185 [Arabidopsis thaliana]|eukprot:NP_001189671.1 hypothetical protein AT2G34185 [Arabidopsis thaliana]
MEAKTERHFLVSNFGTAGGEVSSATENKRDLFGDSASGECTEREKFLGGAQMRFQDNSIRFGLDSRMTRKGGSKNAGQTIKLHFFYAGCSTWDCYHHSKPIPGYLGLINGGIFLYTNIYCGLLCNSKQEIEVG